jgi:hypothetical protein
LGNAAGTIPFDPTRSRSSRAVRPSTDQAGSLDDELVRREQVEVEHAGGVRLAPDPPGLRLDPVQQGQQRLRLGVA